MAGYEKRDIDAVKIIAYSVIGIIILAAIIGLLYNYFMAEKEEIVYEQTLKPESSLLRDIRAKEEAVLNSYKLLDPQRGIYQIPIERAMQLLAEENFQHRLPSR